MLSNALYDRTSSVCRFLAVFLSVVLIIGLAPLPAYADPGYTAASTDGTVETTTGEGSQLAAEDASYVAKIGDTGYETLQAAFDGAKSGDTVTLVADIDDATSTMTIAVDKSIVFDINGKTLERANNGGFVVQGELTLVDSAAEKGVIKSTTDYSRAYATGLISVSGTLNIDGAYIDAVRNDPTNKGQFAVALGNSAATVNMKSGQIKAGWYAISGNGNNAAETTVNVTGGELISTADYAIYQPQPGVINISDGVVYGQAGGICLNRGTLNMTGGIVTSKGTGTTGTWGDGTGNLGNAAIYVNARYGDSSAKISGGSVLAEGDASPLKADKSKHAASVAITGGEFSGQIPDEFCSEGYTPIALDDGSGKYIVGVTGAVARIGNVAYGTVQAAINAAKAGETVALVANATEQVIVPAAANVTLDLNDYEIKNAGDVIYNNGNLRIIDGSDAGNGAITSTGDGGIGCLSNSVTTFESGTINSVEGAIFTGKNTGATVNIIGGTLNASDNAVVASNGSAGAGGNTINISGGTFNGRIKTSGYVACGIYAPNNDTWNISGGTFNIVGGAGIVARAGKVNLSGNVVINTTGSATGKVGDSRVVVPCSAIVFDSSANYPGLADGSAISVQGGTFKSQEASAVAYVGDKGRIGISAGAFSDDSGNEVNIPEGKTLAQSGGDGLYRLVDQYTVSFDAGNGIEVASQTIVSGGTATKPADPEKEGYIFTGWYNGEGAFDFLAAVTESVALTAKWRLNTDELTEAITAAETALENAKSGDESLTAGDKYATYEVKAALEEAIETAKDASKSEDLDPQGVHAAAAALKTAQDAFIDALKPVWGVAFDANGGTGALAGAVPVIDGDTLAKVDNPTRDEHSFVGWFLNDDEYDFDTPVKSNITLTAHWAKKEIAQIGETTYPSLAKAIAAAKAGDTVKLLADANEPGVTIAEDITLDLNGRHYVMTDGNPAIITGAVALVNKAQENGSIASASSSAINVLGSGSLTVTDGVQVSGSSEDGKARGISGADKARIRIEGGMVDGVMDGIAVWGEAEAEIAGGTVSATGGNSTGAQSFESAKLTISGGTVTGMGTGAQTASTLIVTGGTISGTSGHGVYASDNGKAMISGGVITSNGVDLKTDTGGTIEVSGGYFAHEINPVYCVDGLMPKDAPEASGQYAGRYTVTQAQVTITFVNDGGTELAKQTVEYGAIPEYEGTTPTKEATAEYTYEFASWDKEIVAATADATYTATYTSTKRSYTITWLNEDGTELSTQTEEYGVVPSYAGTATPAKAADDRYTYTHDGWTPTIAVVTGDATYTATFTAQPRSYTVTFADENGDTISTARYPYGTAAADIVQPAEPTKAQDERWVYYFSAWTPAIADVTGDATYTASYRNNSRMYTVTWYDEDGTTVLGTSQVAAADRPVYTGATPTKADDAQYTYEFSGWDRGLSLVSEDTSYRATYRGTLNTYTVKFVDEDGAVLDTQEVAYGSTPVYGGLTPTKDATASKHFTFAGWDKALAPVAGDVTYTATYSDAPNTFTITWLNEDGTVLETDEGVEYGATPEYNGATPAKAADAQYSYTFAGWGDLGTVSGDASYTAKYTSALNSYTITFVDEDGNALDQQSVAYGSRPEYAGETPTKAADAQYTYTFAGWDPAVADVTGEATYVATFDAAVNSYLVTFADEDGTVLQASRVAYGETPAYAGATPTKAGTVESTFAFSGWSPTVEAVTGAATYTAQYAESARTYAITYLNWDGSVWRIFPSEEYGSLTPVAPAPLREPTEQYSYTFAGWTPSVATSVSGAATYRALFDRIENTHTVTFLDEDGTVLQSSEVVHGAMPTAPADPAKAADDDYTYAFAGWDKEIVAADEDATYTATYAAALIDKVSLSVAAQTLAVGGTFKAPVDSATGDVTWSSSNPAIARVSSDGTVTAIASGSVIITARCGSASASYPVTVAAPASNTNNGSGGNSGSGSNSGSNASSGSGSNSGSSTSGGSSASSGSSSTRTSGSTSSGTTTTTRNVTNNYYTTNSTSTPAAAPAAATAAPTAADNDADDDADESDADGNGNASENSAAAAPTDPATAARNAAQAIVDDANPLDSGAAESIEEDENPLSSGLDSAMVQPDARQVTPWWIWAVAGAVAIGGLVLLIGKRRKNDEEEDERLRA